METQCSAGCAAGFSPAGQPASAARSTPQPSLFPGTGPGAVGTKGSGFIDGCGTFLLRALSRSRRCLAWEQSVRKSRPSCPSRVLGGMELGHRQDWDAPPTRCKTTSTQCLGRETLSEQ